jgi:hypothetical protein
MSNALFMLCQPSAKPEPTSRQYAPLHGLSVMSWIIGPTTGTFLPMAFSSVPPTAFCTSLSPKCAIVPHFTVSKNEWPKLPAPRSSWPKIWPVRGASAPIVGAADANPW